MVAMAASLKTPWAAWVAVLVARGVPTATSLAVQTPMTTWLWGTDSTDQLPCSLRAAGTDMCGECEGDCDTDDHCADDLVCGHRDWFHDPAPWGCTAGPSIAVSGYDYCVCPAGPGLCSQAITPAPTPAPASATGDPHLQNLHGERFDLMVPGAHVLIRIPRGERAENALLLVQADVRRLGAECSDMYFQSVNVTGSWAEAKQKGGYHYSVSQIAATSSEWVVFGKVAVKVVIAHTGKGVQYFNVYAKHLGLSGFVVGGLLGEDDHEEASTPPDACVKRVFLEKKGAGSAIQTLHIGSFAEASSA